MVGRSPGGGERRRGPFLCPSYLAKEGDTGAPAPCFAVFPLGRSCGFGALSCATFPITKGVDASEFGP